ncbi:hypothetical protein I6D99_09320, partial [Staphylococcus aureus]|nr:hypothetical protein [Staphylococcus aureus]
ENDVVVSLATAHYEATTNSAFLIYLFAKDLPNHDELMTQTLHQFERQTEIDYIHPTNDGHTKKVDLFLKKNIKLTKDIYGTSVKSNYILKYVFANGIAREIIYALLEEMDLRKPF